MNQAQWMNEAVALAEEAAADGEIPVGAVVVDREGRIIGRGRNRRESGDPLGHAELLAIAEAAKEIGDWRLEGTTMVVTLEPCAMCAGALVNARVDRLIFGASDPKAGFCGSLGNWWYVNSVPWFRIPLAPPQLTGLQDVLPAGLV